MFIRGTASIWHGQIHISYVFIYCFSLYLDERSSSDILFIADAEKVVGWAKNHYLSSCLLPNIKGDRLQLPRERF